MIGTITSGEQQIKWDKRMLGLAKHVATWSKDPSTQVGAVLACHKKVVSLGYNGFPPEIEDTYELLHDREAKYEKVVHAEKNAIRFANRDGRLMTLYTYPFPPCRECAEYITDVEEHGVSIRRVVAPFNIPDRWRQSVLDATIIFEKAGIEVDYNYEIIRITRMGMPTHETYIARM